MLDQWRGGKVFMVTDDTLQTALKYQFVATGIQPGRKLGRNWCKTVWDLISDLISLRPGDAIFFWLYQRRYTGIVGLFEVEASNGTNVFFDNRDIGAVPGANFPFRVLIRPRQIYKTIAMDDLLLADPKYIPWTSALSAKKALGAFGGRGRSSTPLPPWGVEAVVSALEEAEFAARWYGDDVRIEIPSQVLRYPFDENRRQITVDVSKRTFPNRYPKYPGEIDLDLLPAASPDGRFSVEKALEAWLMENIEKPEVRSTFLDDPDEILWFANYFPCSVSGVNIDALTIYRSSDGSIRVLVTELKKNAVVQNFEESIYQVVRYVNVASRLFASPIKERYREDVKIEAAICGFNDKGYLDLRSRRLANLFETRMQVPLRVIGYRIDTNTVQLTALA